MTELSAANMHNYLVKVIREALEDHARPRGGLPGCTYCQGALAALEQLGKTDSFCTCGTVRPEGRPWYAHQPGCLLRDFLRD